VGRGFEQQSLPDRWLGQETGLGLECILKFYQFQIYFLKMLAVNHLALYDVRSADVENIATYGKIYIQD
jgi:hypothetical protein